MERQEVSRAFVERNVPERFRGIPREHVAIWGQYSWQLAQTLIPARRLANVLVDPAEVQDGARFPVLSIHSSTGQVLLPALLEWNVRPRRGALGKILKDELHISVLYHNGRPAKRWRWFHKGNLEASL